ncbi:MAG: nucleoside monophosphate kinase, partial [Planctomycetota bacterium]|nr:nucleoside monophosphate kinase [Planctomycetota bacterium]
MADPYKCVLLFGAPGTGKGTQGKMLGENDGFIHLATGDIFRSLDKESELGQKFLYYSSRGELVPDDLTIRLWQDHVRGLIDAGTYDPTRDILLLDGMPR